MKRLASKAGQLLKTKKAAPISWPSPPIGPKIQPDMRRFLFALAAALFLLAAPSRAQTSLPPSATSGALIFDDEFSGSAIDTSLWTVIVRHGEYSQDETECNTASAVTESGGSLVITTTMQSATCGDFNPDGTVWHTPSVWPYTSGDVQWKSFYFTYGTVEIRAAFPNQNTGLWPATWLLGQNCQATNPETGETGVGSCPSISTSGYTETDMTECFADHWCGFGVFNPSEIGPCDAIYPLSDTNYHVYDLTWTPTEIDQYMDGNQVAACTQASTNPMFLIMQIQTAIGMGVPANLPASLSIDYVRVYANDYTTTGGGAPPLSIGSPSFPAGTVGTAYSGSVTATGGNPPYSFSATGLEANLVINTSGSSGIVTGTPTIAETDAGTVTVTDSTSKMAETTYSFVVSAAAPPPPPTLTISPANFPSGTVNVTYSGSVNASGGTPPYTFSATGLEAGLSIGTSGSAGIVTGTPTVAETDTGTVTVTDSAKAAASETYSFVIAAAPPPPPPSTNMSFALTPSPATLSVTQGATSGNTVNLTVTDPKNTGFLVTNDGTTTTVLPLTYSCSNLPSESSCSFSPSATTTATALSVAFVSSAPTAQLHPPLGSGILWAMLLPGLFGIVLSVRSRKGGVRLLCLIAFLGFSAVWLGSCGGGSNPQTNPGTNSGTPAGTYTVTINATTGSSAPIANSTTIQFTVQ